MGVEAVKAFDYDPFAPAVMRDPPPYHSILRGGRDLAPMEVSERVAIFLRTAGEFDFDKEGAVRHPSSFQWGWNALPVVVG